MVSLKAYLPFLFFAVLSLTVANGQEVDTLKVKAKKGDGIYSVLRNNGFEPTIHLKQFISLNEEVLGKDTKLLIGQSYILPFKRKDPLLTSVVDSIIKPATIDTIPEPTAGTISKIPVKPIFKDSIFGKENSSITIENDTLKGAVYYLVSGHGGPDPGATEELDGKLLCEDEYAYDVTLRLARRLISQGAKVYIIVRDKNDGIRNKRILKADRDEVNYPDLKIPLNQLSRLKQRTKTVNDLYTKNKGSYQRLVVLHVDSRADKDIDVFFYHHKKSKTGKKFAQNLQNTFNKKYGIYQPKRNYLGTVSSRMDLYLIRKVWPVMTYIELGNIKSKKDRRRLLDPENRDALAKWIAEGMLLDYTQNISK